MKTKKESNNKIKKTIYIENELNKKIKIKAIMEKETESSLVNNILSEYFTTRDKT